MKTKGWKNVFAFTFTQQIKTKSFIIGTIVIMLIVAIIAFLANFLPALFIGDGSAPVGGGGSSATAVNTLYINNETGYNFDFSPLSQAYALNVKEISPAEAETKINELTNTSENAVVSRMYLDNDVICIDSKYAVGETAVKKGDCETITSSLSSMAKAQFLTLSGLPEDKVVTALTNVNTTVSAAGEEPVGMIQSIMNSVVPMLSAIVLFIFIFSYSQLVAQAIAIEKSSRIVEYLLTSIKPLALIIGKVLAMCAVSLLQFVLIGLGGGLGFLISMPFGITSKLSNMMASAGAAGMPATGLEAQSIIDDIAKAFSNVDVIALIIMILTFVFGFLLYAGIAGVAGASVSKMEDLAGAIQPLSLIGVLGFYLAYFPQVMGEENTMTTVARYLPISSPFVLSSDYILGKIGVVEALISIAILIAADIIVMMFVAKVYESIILHTGNRLKIGDMLKMSK